MHALGQCSDHWRSPPGRPSPAQLQSPQPLCAVIRVLSCAACSRRDVKVTRRERAGLKSDETNGSMPHMTRQLTATLASGGQVRRELSVCGGRSSKPMTRCVPEPFMQQLCAGVVPMDALLAAPLSCPAPPRHPWHVTGAHLYVPRLSTVPCRHSRPHHSATGHVPSWDETGALACISTVGVAPSSVCRPWLPPR